MAAFVVESISGNPVKGDDDFDGGEGVKEDMDAIDDWVC